MVLKISRNFYVAGASFAAVSSRKPQISICLSFIWGGDLLARLLA